MPSFISSSRPIAIAAFAALAVYAAIIEVVRPKISFYPDQDAFNLARAERFLIAAKPYDTVLLGSSLAVRIPDDWLPDDMLNLSFGGMSAQTGLALIARNRDVPRRVLIETNTFDIDIKPEFEAAARGPIPLGLRRLVRALRAEMRPVNLVLSEFGEARTPPLLKRGSRGLAAACATLLASPERDGVQPDVVARSVAGEAGVEQNSVGLAAAAARLADGVRTLRARGVEVAFVELPVDSALGARTDARRQALAAAVPDATFLRFDATEFQTEDGQHLAPISARRFACRLRERLYSM